MDDVSSVEYVIFGFIQSRAGTLLCKFIDINLTFRPSSSIVCFLFSKKMFVLSAFQTIFGAVNMACASGSRKRRYNRFPVAKCMALRKRNGTIF